MITSLQHKNSFASVVAIVLSILLGATAAWGQTTGFTYQGRLTDGSTPANGNYDLQFALFDSLSGGTQVGSTQTLNTVPVSNGVFTVSLDFGANSFPGASRFLEISARPSGAGSFTLLTPRQAITSTPYAVRSLNASSADSVPASGVPPGSGNYIQNATSPQSSSNFNITGNGTAGGTLGGNIVNATSQYNLNGSRILSNAGTGNLFAGVGAGTANTTGFANTFVGANAGTTQTTAEQNTFIGFETGKANTAGFNTFVGSSAGRSNTTGFANSFFGFNAGSNNTTGTGNSFFGVQAGLNNTNGNSNSFFGTDAGGNNMTGSFNAFFGTRAAFSNLGGSENAFFGNGAGFSNTFGNNNAFFGRSAGVSNTAGEFNTAIGFLADILPGPIFNPTNATAIGARAQVTNSNSLVLGGITGINGGTNTNVGIGTTAPTRLLHLKGLGSDGSGNGDLLVTGTGTVGAAITFESTGTGGRKYSWISTTNSVISGGGTLAAFDVTAGAYRMVIDSAGNVGIGIVGPLDRFHVFGDIRMGTSGTNGCLKRNDGFGLVGTCSSDQRFKRDITPFPSLLNKVAQLRPVHYYWRATEFPEKHFGNTQGYGLVAQEVEQVLPELVSEDEQGYKLVDYSKLPLLLLQAIRELKMENDQLKLIICADHPQAAICQPAKR